MRQKSDAVATNFVGNIGYQQRCYWGFPSPTARFSMIYRCWLDHPLTVREYYCKPFYLLCQDTFLDTFLDIFLDIFFGFLDHLAHILGLHMVCSLRLFHYKRSFFRNFRTAWLLAAGSIIPQRQILSRDLTGDLCLCDLCDLSNIGEIGYEKYSSANKSLGKL